MIVHQGEKLISVDDNVLKLILLVANLFFLQINRVRSFVDEHGNFKRSKIYRDNYGKPDFTNLDEVVAEIDA